MNQKPLEDILEILADLRRATGLYVAADQATGWVWSPKEDTCSEKQGAT